ncbi:adenosine kinase [Planctomycetaceae bacterium]|jgi:sugar/nucleoside kinase (ribokinase family)|nr:adenosine kinase [Planctomycetaceae bacterium]MDC0273390.1 adenosine kinase [Planctomycetaceae bacterium]MDC0307730.1 adenosine kinase [Planctomycetaceae bacterium]MDG2389294.1 adenosine kinase [Planctomycetaceae bacterium]
MSYDVFGVGASLVDIQAQVDDGLIRDLGFDKGIMTLVEEDAQQKVLEQLAGISITRCAGGSAANTIMGVADFGGTAAFAGKVGADEIGEFFLQDMRKMGVTIEVPTAEGQTGTSVVLISDDAQRTMLTHLGVSATLGPDDINEDEIKKAKYVYVEGYLFTGDSTKDAAYKTIELAKKHNVKVAFTVSDPFLIGLFRDEFLQLIEGPVDLLFCNEEEAKSLTEKENPIDCAHEIHKHAENVALTMGGDGSILMHNGDVIPIESVQVKAIDTTGAGDMYAAGVLFGITNGYTWRQAGHLASHAAARVVSQLGARLKDSFTAEQIQTLMSESELKS